LYVVTVYRHTHWFIVVVINLGNELFKIVKILDISLELAITKTNQSCCQGNETGKINI